MIRRYKYLREQVRVDMLSAAFIAVMNSAVDMPEPYVGFMHIIWNMDTNESNI